jgi:hypothetical protein
MWEYCVATTSQTGFLPDDYEDVVDRISEVLAEDESLNLWLIELDHAEKRLTVLKWVSARNVEGALEVSKEAGRKALWYGFQRFVPWECVASVSIENVGYAPHDLPIPAEELVSLADAAVLSAWAALGSANPETTAH